MKAGMVLMVCTFAAAVVDATGFEHSLQGKKPWTGEGFLDDPKEFHFAIIGDRAGGERKGYFGKAMDSLNLLRPEFTICVGDLINCGGQPDADKQWEELQGFIGRLKMPFFYVVGNHDIWTGFTGMSPERKQSIDLWKENCGTNTYYSFKYNGCLFVCFNTMEKHDYMPPREALSENQIEWALGEFEKHKDARWRFLFMHKPIDWTSDRWLEFERRINKYDYTVFAGDWHNFCTATRHGKKYYMLGTVGGDHAAAAADDLRYGYMDGITWVTMTKDEGPVISHIALSGIYGDTIQTCATTQGWIETPLDYPSHLAENPAKYKDETNTSLIPTEVMHGPGYDWHFKHAIVLRQGQVCKKMIPGWGTDGKPRVILLGDESASAEASKYGANEAFDMGFKGDRIENVMWRVIQGTLDGYRPTKIVISVGQHNRGVNTEAEIVAGMQKLIALVREREPEAEIEVR